jgi:hypothetical protein
MLILPVFQAGNDTVAEKFTLVGQPDKGILTTLPTGYPAVAATITNSVFLSNTTAMQKGSNTTLTHDYNAFYGNTTNFSGTSQAANETISTNPTYDTATYGNGAYLIKPSNLATSGEGGTYIGAEALYRYQDGSLTSAPLWPWPMEARICAETGYSVTYENGYGGCANGGGLWKTLNGVYSGLIFNPADVNQDGSINIKDIQICVKVITGTLANSRADVNGDGVKNIKDIQAIVRAIIGG